MSPWWGVTAVLLLLAVFLEEGWVRILVTGSGLGENGEARRRGRDGRLLANVFLTLAAGAFWVAALRTDSGQGRLLGLVGAVVVSAWGAGLAGVSWRSPLALLGRSLTTPMLPAGRLVGWVVDWVRQRAGAPDTSWEWEAWESGDPAGDTERALATLQEFHTSVVEDVMVPREEVEGLQADWTVSRALEVIATLGFSRYPVYSESLDAVTGVLHVFDLVGAGAQDPVRRYVRPAFMTTETKPITQLLQELQQSYNQMAVVVDEMGGTAGVVTVEDLLEELVGEIEDESDAPETQIKSQEPGVYWVDASVRIEDLNEQLGLNLPEGEYDTAAGLLLERLERIPKIGERVTVAGVSFEVVTSEPHRVGSLRLTLKNLKPSVDRR